MTSTAYYGEYRHHILKLITSRLRDYKSNEIQSKLDFDFNPPYPIHIRIDEHSIEKEYSTTFLRRKKTKTVTKYRYVLEFDEELSENDYRTWHILVIGMFLFKGIL